MYQATIGSAILVADMLFFNTVKPETLALLNFGETWFKEFWQKKRWRNAGKGAYFVLKCAFILLGGFILKG